MVCWIEHPLKPKSLILVWQAPVGVADRLRWAVGRLASEADGSSFAYLADEEFQAMNLGRSYQKLKASGFRGYPAFDRMRKPDAGNWDDALSAFIRRVPPRRRPDFSAYLAHHRVKLASELSPLALLAVTEAHLPGDGFSLIDPLDPSAEAVDFIFEIAGFRHSDRPIAAVEEGQLLTLTPEPDNRWDPLAIQVVAKDVCIGYVNRLQAATIQEWLSSRNVQCCIARLNGQPSVPKAFAFMRVRPLSSAVAA